MTEYRHTAKDDGAGIWKIGEIGVNLQGRKNKEYWRQYGGLSLTVTQRRGVRKVRATQSIIFLNGKLSAMVELNVTENNRHGHLGGRGKGEKAG